jgi:hypothetical protein
LEHFAQAQARSDIQPLSKRSGITEIGNAIERTRGMARSFAESPENTLGISPDSASRRELNNAIRTEYSPEEL